MRKLCAASILILWCAVSGYGGVIQVSSRAAWDAAVIGPTNIGFEGIAGAGTFADLTGTTPTYSGVTFAQMGVTGNPYMIVVDGAFPVGDYNRGSGASLQIGAPNYSGPGSFLRATMPAGVLAVAADLFSVAGNASNLSSGVTVTLSTGQSFLITTPASSGAMTFFGVTSDVAITSIDFGPLADRAAFLNIDNVSFATSTVPEPSTLLFVGAGLVMAGIVRRRKK